VSRNAGDIPPQVGEGVTVIYDPSRPREAKVKIGSTLRFRPKMLVVAEVGALFVVPISLIVLCLADLANYPVAPSQLTGSGSSVVPAFLLLNLAHSAPLSCPSDTCL